MGAEVTTCCGARGDHDTQLEIDGCISLHDGAPTKQQVHQFTQDEVETFQKLFYEGIPIRVILQDRSTLSCQIQLDRTHEHLLLSCDKRVRLIPLHDIKAFLSTPEQLKRVESCSIPIQPEICAAIHLGSSGNCIPLFFDFARDKALFLEVVETVRSAAKHP